jgi:hypothetical protein
MKHWGALVAAAMACGMAWGDDSFPPLPAPVAGDYMTILKAQPGTLSIFEYEGRQSILIIDFPSLLDQGRMFNRVVALIERMGAPRERVLSNADLAAFIKSVGKTEATFAFGNDFMIAELVVFFNLAEIGNIQLTAQELALRQFLLDRRLMIYRHGFFQAVSPKSVILSIPQIGPGGPGSPPVNEMARRTILSHEISHGEYYTNPQYTEFCRRFWKEAMTDAQRAAFRKFLSSSSYNPENEEMMINEGQAYLMYTPDPRAFNAKMVGLGEKEIAALRKRFRAGYQSVAQVPVD